VVLTGFQAVFQVKVSRVHLPKYLQKHEGGLIVGRVCANTRGRERWYGGSGPQALASLGWWWYLQRLSIRFISHPFALQSPSPFDGPSLIIRSLGSHNGHPDAHYMNNGACII
jgi:hypothetical protein